MEKTCNLTVATEDVQVRIHIWNFSLPASKHAERALNINSGYRTTYQSMLRKLLVIYVQKSEQWHTEEFNLLPGRQLLLCLAASGISVTVICFWTDTVLLQKRYQRTGTPFTGSELYTLIKNPPDRKHLFFLRSMIDLICSWKEKGFKNSLQLSSLSNWGWNKIISAFCQPETCNEVSGYETLTPCPSSPLANLPVHSMSSTFANHSFRFQVSFWSFSMHRILFCLFFISTKPKTKIWM